MSTIERVNCLAAERGMSVYKLAKVSEVSYSTFRTAAKRNGELTVDVVRRICAALNITIADFFADVT